MNTMLKAGAVLGAVAMLAGCAGNYDVDGVSMMSDQGDAFDTALHKRYTERAQFEVNEGDWSSVDFFNSRAKMAAMGEAVAAQMPGDRALKADGDAINSAYGALSNALNSHAPRMTPDACARAQTWFEHWMEQGEEGHQPDHIASARGEFEKAMPECKGDMAKPMTKMMAKLPDPLIIYFAHDSSEVTGAADTLISMAAKAAMSAGATRAVVIGHTDTSGNSAYNMSLSQSRARGVVKSLVKHGVSSAVISDSHAGETSLQVQTGDGMKERMNRRVEVMFER